MRSNNILTFNSKISKTTQRISNINIYSDREKCALFKNLLIFTKLSAFQEIIDPKNPVSFVFHLSYFKKFISLQKQKFKKVSPSLCKIDYGEK